VEDVQWDPTIAAGSFFGNTTSTTQFETGATLTAVSATLTGDLSTCNSFYIVDLESSGHLTSSPYLATWSGTGANNTSPLAANSYVGTTRTATSAGPFEVTGTCDAMVGGNPTPINFPVGIQVAATIQWSHPIATRAIN
jgi:hypothetical protein